MVVTRRLNCPLAGSSEPKGASHGGFSIDSSVGPGYFSPFTNNTQVESYRSSQYLLAFPVNWPEKVTRK